jgi:hypothetical protein
MMNILREKPGGTKKHEKNEFFSVYDEYHDERDYEYTFLLGRNATKHVSQPKERRKINIKKGEKLSGMGTLPAA